jgi:hypothetical protein
MKKIIYWTPRVLSIIYILFLSIFSLDVFAEGYSIPQALVAFFMHLIPAIIVLLAFLFATKKPLYGGISFLILAFAFSVFFMQNANMQTFVIIGSILILPLLLIGILFILNKYYVNDR